MGLEPFTHAHLQEGGAQDQQVRGSGSGVDEPQKMVDLPWKMEIYEHDQHEKLIFSRFNH